MPHRAMSREQMWILPPSLEELLPGGPSGSIRWESS